MAIAGQINIDSTTLSACISHLQNSKTSLETDAKTAITSAFSALEACGLFTSGLAQLKAAIESLVTSHDTVISSLNTHLSQMQQQETQIQDYIGGYTGGYSGGGSSGGGGYSGGSQSQYEESTMEHTDQGKKISDSELSTSISGVEIDGMKTLLSDLIKKAGEYGTTLTELLLNPEKSGLLVEILKKLNGDTNAEIDTTSTDATNTIQKTLLAKLSSYDENIFASLSEKSILVAMKYLTEFAKTKGLTLDQLLYDDNYTAKLMIALRNCYDGKPVGDYTPTAEETAGVKAALDEIAKKNNMTVDSLLSSTKNIDKIKEKTETKIIKKEAPKEETTTTTTTTSTDTPVDVSTLPAAGEYTSKWNTLGDDWIVPTTKASVTSYASYVASSQICQTNDTSKFGDKCLSFAETHAYALYTGNTGDSAERASAYPHSTSFTSWFSDSKEETLKKIYSEVVSGRPVVIQVNGNKAGTSRHFVTVVGVRASVTDVNKLTEQDLLIIDSWDGKTERMDTSTSRFLTTGAACHKNYSGYYLRVLKS